MTERTRYRFSFTAGALMQKEMLIVASFARQNNISLNEIDASILAKARAKTNKREFSEVSIRLKTLSQEELTLFTNANDRLAKQLCLLACLRTYNFIKDFFTEVILEKITLYDFKIVDRDYNSFIHKMQMEHPELEALSESTKLKIKQVLFRILVQSKIIDSLKGKHINLNYLEPELKSLLQQNSRKAEIKLLLG